MANAPLPKPTPPSSTNQGAAGQAGSGTNPPQPPTAVTALSSMSSNKLPAQAVAPPNTPSSATPPQTTPLAAISMPPTTNSGATTGSTYTPTQIKQAPAPVVSSTPTTSAAATPVFSAPTQHTTIASAQAAAAPQTSTPQTPAPAQDAPPTTTLSSASAPSPNTAGKPPVPPPASAQNQGVPQTTVLGRPLPQAIRGESAPVGLSNRPPLPVVPPAGSPQPVGGTPVSKPATAMSQPSNTPLVQAPLVSVTQQTQPAASASEAPTAPPTSQIATPKKSIMRFVPLIAGLIILAVVGAFTYMSFFGSSSTSTTPVDSETAQSEGDGTSPAVRTQVPSEQVTIEYWGLWEPSEVMQTIISDFEAKNLGVKVRYTKQSHVDYRERLQTALQSGTGPDVFRYHASWTPMLRQSLDPIPSTVVSTADFNTNYYPSAAQQLVLNGQIVGVPLMYDGLVLYYNEEIFNTAVEQPPKTWADLRRLAVKLTVKSGATVQRGGLAIGNTANVEHFSDILATLILQNEGNFAEPNSAQTRDALLFYTNFLLKDQVWSDALPSSTTAFARGDVAMMFAPSWKAHEIQAMNPKLVFKTAPLPQLSETNRATWATYWAEGISALSTKKQAAASFLAHLNTDENLEKLYNQASTVRAFGEPYPKISLAPKLVDSPYVASVLEDAPYAESWYLNSYTHDNGINDQMIGYYKIAIDSLIQGEEIEIVLELLDEGVTQVLRQYGVNAL